MSTCSENRKLLTESHCAEAEIYLLKGPHVTSKESSRKRLRALVKDRLGHVEYNINWMLTPEAHLCSVLLCHIPKEEILGMTLEEGIAYAYLFINLE